MRLRRRWFRSLVLAFVLLVWVTPPSHALDESAAEGGPATAPSELPELQDKDLRAKEEALKALPEHGEYTIIPIPAFAYSRNERYWIGGLVPILQSNQKGELQNIIAPQYLHNQYIGETGTLNYYGYPSDTAQYSAILSYSTKIERDFEFNYKNVAAGGGRYIVATQFQYFKNAFRRFFGFGNSAPESHETNYTSEEAIVHLTAGININADLAVMWSEHFRSVSVLQGAVESLPQTRGFFPDVNGLEGAEVLGHRVTLRYDTRDKQLIPTRGTYFTAAVEYDHNFRHENSGWFRTTFDGRRYFAHHLPYVEAPAVFVAHFFADATNGGNIPFYERPTLGGENTLRAFGQGRFVSDTAILFNFEERIPIREQKIFDHLLDIELAPFLDLGRVMGRFKASNFQNLQYNPGLGFRVVAKPHVVGRLDVAYGKDGGNLYVGIDYPF